MYMFIYFSAFTVQYIHMLNKKFFTRLLDDDYRRAVILNNDKAINSPSLKLKAYATYVVDKHAKERDDNYKDIKQAGYGFCPFDVIMWVSKNGSVKKLLFEFNSVNHFLVKQDHKRAVEVVLCMLSELVKESKKDVVCFDIDKIEAESKKAQEDYDRMYAEIKKDIEDKMKSDAEEHE